MARITGPDRRRPVIGSAFRHTAGQQHHSGNQAGPRQTPHHVSSSPETDIRLLPHLEWSSCSERQDLNGKISGRVSRQVAKLRYSAIKCAARTIRVWPWGKSEQKDDMRRFGTFLAASFLIVPLSIMPADAETAPTSYSEPNPRISAPPLPPEKKVPGVNRICQLIETSATRHGIPKDFFARLIWKESRFDPGRRAGHCPVHALYGEGARSRRPVRHRAGHPRLRQLPV
jgi:hypothetical protein